MTGSRFRTADSVASSSGCNWPAVVDIVVLLIDPFVV